MTGTYNGVPTHGRAGRVSEIPYTYGGYTTRNVVDEKFVIKVPENYPIESAGVILCAGITLYDPLKHWGALKGGLKIGIAGFGGLGLMGVK
jgi:alcohol dehydrogenase (NADP+)